MSPFFLKKISSLLALGIIILVGVSLTAIIMQKSEKLAKLQEPIPIYIDYGQTR